MYTVVSVLPITSVTALLATQPPHEDPFRSFRALARFSLNICRVIRLPVFEYEIHSPGIDTKNFLKYGPNIFVFKWAIHGLFLIYFLLFSIQLIECTHNICWWLDSNRGPLVSEATALPTESQPLTSKHLFIFVLFSIQWQLWYNRL